MEERMYKLPDAFCKRMEQLLGEDYEAFLKSYTEPSYHGLRINPLKGEGVEQLVKKAFSLNEQVAWCQPAYGYYYEDEVRPGKHPFHEAGLYYIQEPSAMAPATQIEAKPGEWILDLCAAPGGKTTQIASAMQGQGVLVSNEIHPGRAKILAENVERMGISNCVVTNEPPEKLAKHMPALFDKIMVDAPCSGEGMFRKMPEAREEWSEENVMKCRERQLDILAQAVQMLRPGGRLVYSTCTFSKEENEDVIETFCAENPEFHVLKMERFFPHKVKGEGHFLAVLQHQGNFVERKEQEPMLSFQGFEAWGDFAQAELKQKFHGKLVKFGDCVNLLPTEMPFLKGIKIMRAGLQLGTVKKNRFEPGHALALALQQTEANHVLSLSAEQKELYQYMNGETFRYEGEPGWYLILVEGYSLGWGKLAGEIMKNHYPKGLRKKLR